jgi:hypothetical protein
MAAPITMPTVRYRIAISDGVAVSTNIVSTVTIDIITKPVTAIQEERSPAALQRQQHTQRDGRYGVGQHDDGAKRWRPPLAGPRQQHVRQGSGALAEIFAAERKVERK